MSERIKSILGTILILLMISFFIFILVSDNLDGKYYYKPGTIKGKNISFDDEGRNYYYLSVEIDGKTITRSFSSGTYYSVDSGDRVILRMYESKYFKNICIRGLHK